MKKLKNILKESNVQIGKVYSNPYATAFVKETEEREMNNVNLSEEQKQAFLEAVKQYKKYGEAVYRNAGLGKVYESIKNVVNVAEKLTLSETEDWFDNVTVSRHMKRMGESFKVFEKTLKEVSTLQQRLEASYDEIGEVLGKYYEISEELDPVGKEDGDIDNDGDEDASDEYLTNRRKVISKAMKNESMKLTDMIKKPSVNEAKTKNPTIKVSARYAREAGEAFRDAYSKMGKMTSTNTFEFKNADDAEEFAEHLMDYIDIPEEKITGYNLDESFVNEESYKVAGRPVTLIKGKKSDGTDWKVKFQNGKESPLSGVLALIKPFPKGIKESVNEDTKKRFDVDFYKGNGDRQTSHEEIIRGDKFSDIVSQATKVAKSKGMNYVEFYHRNLFIGSIDKRNGYEFKKGRDSEKSPLSINEAKYDIGMARKGNGITVYNRAEEERGDYKNIAHISDNGTVKYYVKNIPNDVKKKIEAEAQKMKESVNEEIKVGSVVTIDYPTLKKPIKSKVVRVLNDKNGLLYVMKDGSVWDAKYISTNESVNESKSMKLTSMIKESFGIGELPSSKLMKMNMSLGEIMNEVSPYGNDVGDSKAGFSVGDSVTITPKAGYWDVTQYPYGGDFKRIPSGQNVSGKVVSGTVKIPTREVRVDINVNGKSRTIVIDKKFLNTGK